MGRPPLGDSKKAEIVRIRMTKAELNELKRVSRRIGLTVPHLLMRPWREDK